MTWNEFEIWYNDLKIGVPTLAKQIADFPNKNKTLQRWFLDVFGDLDLEDCLSVTKSIVCGEQARPFASDIPGFYRGEARRLRWDRTKRDEVPEWKHGQRSNAWEFTTTSGGMRAAFHRAQEIIQEGRSNGMTPEEAIESMRFERRDEWAKLIG